MVEKQLFILQHLFFLIIEGFYFRICVQSRQKEKELLCSIKIFLCLQKSHFYVSFHLNQILEGFLPQIEYTVFRCQYFDPIKDTLNLLRCQKISSSKRIFEDYRRGSKFREFFHTGMQFFDQLSTLVSIFSTVPENSYSQHFANQVSTPMC